MILSFSKCGSFQRVYCPPTVDRHIARRGELVEQQTETTALDARIRPSSAADLSIS